MKLSWKQAVIATAVGSSALLGIVGQAGASGPIASSGQDGLSDVILGGGSDTTYAMENDLGKLYNESPGCATDNASGSATLGQCLASNTAPTANQNTNWDHDVVAQSYPTGSGAGIAGIGTKFDFARSSRVASSAELATKASFGYAKDALVLVTPTGRAIADLTKAQIQGIYNGTITDWSQIPGQAAGTIRAYGMNSSSGTYSTFKSYLGAEPNATGATPGAGVALQSGTFPFENDLKPVLADVSARGWVASDVIWWASFGEMQTFNYKSQGANFWTVGGVAPSTSSIANNTYGGSLTNGLTRILYRIVADADVDLTGTNAANTVLSTTGATAGKGGAVRRTTEFLCQPSSYFDSAGANTALNPFTGQTYFTAIGNTITKNGFQRVPSTERTAGACRVSS